MLLSTQTVIRMLGLLGGALWPEIGDLKKEWCAAGLHSGCSGTTEELSQWSAALDISGEILALPK